MSVLSYAPLLEVQLKSILVATDLSQASEKALCYAVSIARRYSSKIYLVNVVSSLGLTMAGPDAIVHASEIAEKEVAHVKEKLRRGGVLDGIEFEVVVREGEIWRELEKIIRHERIELLVIGTHSRTGLAKLALGSVAERIFRNAHCPVLSIGASSIAETSSHSTDEARILFPTDFGDRSLRPLPYALWLARQLRARLVVYHALSRVFAPTDMMRHNMENGIDMHAEVKAACLERLRSVIPASFLEEEPIYEAEFGEPAEAILQAAKKHNAKAIIMGLTHTRHVDALSHMPWTMTYNVVCGAECPVLTVRA